MNDFTAKFKQVESDNFEEFLKATGVGLIARKVVLATKQVIEISVKGDECSINVNLGVKTINLKCTLGQEFTETLANDTECQTIITKEGENKLKQVRNNGITILREFSENSMLQTMTKDKVIATMKFDKVE